MYANMLKENQKKCIQSMGAEKTIKNIKLILLVLRWKKIFSKNHLILKKSKKKQNVGVLITYRQYILLIVYSFLYYTKPHRKTTIVSEKLIGILFLLIYLTIITNWDIFNLFVSSIKISQKCVKYT